MRPGRGEGRRVPEKRETGVERREVGEGEGRMAGEGCQRSES